MTKSRSWFLLFLAAALSFPAAAYDLPKVDNNKTYSPEVQALQVFSRGVAKLSSQASQAVVFVSVSKTIKGMPFDINPFDFFFGPRGRMPPGGPGGQVPERKQQGLGSGFIVDMDKGYVITNNHVVDEADEISLKLANGKIYDGKILGRDKHTDVAVVHIKEKNFDKKGLTALRLGDSDKIATGEFVIALGAPFGLEASVSTGVISATKRGNLDIIDLGNFLQTDAAINPGNSGGPLLNVEGEVIGVNTAIFSRSGTSGGIGFAIPSNIVRAIANELINKGSVSRGYLGVSLRQDLTEEISAGLGLPEKTKGALVSYVQAGTPAAKAGLESGDVIVAVEGKPVESNSDLTNHIGLLSPGTKVKVEFFRKGKLKDTTITLGKYPDQEAIAGMQDGQRSQEAPGGLYLETLNPQSPNFKSLQAQFGFTSKQGLLVVEVEENSKAQAAGIRPGDVLLKANKEKLTTVKDFEEVFKSSGKLLLQLEREGSLLFASIRK